MKKNNKTWSKGLKKVVIYIGYFIVGLVVITYRMLISFIKNSGRFIAGVYGIVYKVIPYFTEKIYCRIPKLVKTTIIYILVAGTILGIHSTHNVVLANSINEINQTTIELKENKILSLIKKNTKLSKENKSYSELKAELEKVKQENQKLRTIDSLNTIENDIYNKAIQTGMTHEQAILVISISKHETGKWTSKAFKTKNNFGGIMCSTGLKTYSTYEDGLNSFINLLKNRYFDKGLNTIEEIGNVYCPVGASNDPTGVNQYWIPNITKFYNEYLNK